METLAFWLINYSFLALSVGERLLFLSLAGWLLVWLVAGFFHRRRNNKQVAMAPLWTVYLLWLVPAALSLFPGMAFFSVHLPHRLVELISSIFLLSPGLSEWVMDNPCAISPAERLGNSLLGSSNFVTTSNVLFLGWSLISVLLLLRLVFQRAQFRAYLRQSTQVDDASLQQLLIQLGQDFNLARPVRLYSSNVYPAPFTMGIWRPAIFIPRNLWQALNAQELKAVLAHECAHIARHDDLAVCWQQFLAAVFFFNPLLRYANRQLAQMREIYCDKLVIRRCQFSPNAYANTLLRVVEYLAGDNQQLHQMLKTNGQKIPVPALLGQDLPLRVRALIKPDVGYYRWRPPLFLLVGLLCVSFFLGGSGKPMAPVVEGNAVKALVKLPYVMPIADGLITGGVHMNKPLGCQLPDRESFHGGIDFAPRLLTGAQVRAFAGGVVERVSKPPGDIGFMVRIAHGSGLHSTYVRLDKVDVKAGARLQVGQVFGSIGASSQTDHLHFELTHQGRILDPASLFQD